MLSWLKIRFLPYYLTSTSISHLSNKELAMLAHYRSKRRLAVMFVVPIHINFKWFEIKNIKNGMHKLHVKPHFGKITLRNKVIYRNIWWMNMYINYNLPWEY